MAVVRRSGAIDVEIEIRSWLLAALRPHDSSEVHAECRRIVDMLDLPDLWPISKVHGMTAAARALLDLQAWEEAFDLSDRFVREAVLFLDEPDFLARAYRHRGFAHLGLGNSAAARADLEAALAIARSFAPAWWTAEIDAALAGLPTD